MSIMTDIAEVLEAGARRSAQWTYNVERQQQAEVLRAMAEEARAIDARRREALES